MNTHAHHAHHNHRHESKKKLFIVLCLTALYMFAEWIGGYLSRSLSLMADAGHMLSDVAALGLSLFAIWVAKKPPKEQSTFGYYRMEILAALINGVTLLLIAVWVLKEAYERFWTPESVVSGMMMTVAVGGLIVNLIGIYLLHGGRSESINMRGAWLHVWMDALGSVGVIISSLVIQFTGFMYADPIASVLISLLVIYSAWSLIKETVAILMENAPGHLDPDSIRGAMLYHQGVSEVHDLHIWTITSGIEALSAHVVMDGTLSGDEILKGLQRELEKRFHIHHITLQLESSRFASCTSCDA